MSLHHVSARALMAAALIGTPSLARAQSAPQVEPEIVVTAPLEGASIESLQGATVLRRDEVIENLNGGLGNSLDALPGVATSFFGAGASRPIIRGLGEDRVRVLQNGVGAIDASTASPDHAVSSDGLDAERIEVLRGAAALAYGGNAVGGVVNIIDNSIPRRAIEGVEGQAMAAFSTVDEGRQGQLSLGVGAGPFALHFGIAQRETEPYEIPGAAALHNEIEEDEHEESEGVAPNTWTDYSAYDVGASYVGSWGFVGLAAKRTEGEYGLVGHEHEEEDEEHEDEPNLARIAYEQTRYEARGDFRVNWGAFDRLDFAAQQSDYQHTEFESDGAAGASFFSDGWEGRLEAHHRGELLQGAVGLQLSDVDFSAEGEEAFIAPVNTRDLGAFVVERLDFGRWGLEGGARIERRELVSERFGAREFDSLSGSAGVFLRPAEDWFFGATLARTERAPTAFELFSDGPHLATRNYELGDPSLDQEIATSLEFSSRYQGDRVQVEMNLFAIDFADYIALVDRGDVFWLDEESETSGFAASEDDPAIPEGAEVLPVFHFAEQDASFLGGELSVRAKLFELAGFSFSSDAALDLVNASFDAGSRPPRIPPRTLTVGVEVESDYWTARLEAVDTAKQDRLAALETVTDGFTFVNAGLAWRPEGEGGPWTISLNGRNLTDEEGRVHSSFLKNELPLPGRNVRLTLSATF
ncbi:MAG: TonB-dependent receptor [Hyphomonadaceae bacterium]|nr:TonB-dependent receptor [Hyphomonadaceae bacterium]